MEWKNVTRTKKAGATLVRILAALLLLSIGNVLAAGQPDAGKSATDNKYESWILLDPDQGLPRQLEEAKRVKVAADAGDALAQYLLGTLYRLGKSHPARVFERDDDNAEKYLSNAAINGEVFAMAGMAELELRRKRLPQARLWAQVFARYEAVYVEALGGNPDSRQAYAAFLIGRIDPRPGRAEATDKQLRQDFFVFQQDYDTQIRAAFAKLKHPLQSANNKDQEELRRFGSLQMDLLMPRMWEHSMDSPGDAIFLGGVNAKGRIEKLLVIDSLPDQVFAAGLDSSVRSGRFNTAKVDAPLRWARMPARYDDQSVELKKSGK